MKILYGCSPNYIDVTKIAIEKCLIGDILLIPSDDDNRAKLFGDPMFRVLKHILIVENEWCLNEKQTRYDADQVISLNIKTMLPEKLVYNPKKWWREEGVLVSDVETKLKGLHDKISLVHGTMDEEYCEQVMAVKYIKEDDVVLELGGNVGRNTIVISCILKDERNLVTLECDSHIAQQLRENCENNGLVPHIEASALSKRKLIQRFWDTIPSDEVLPGWSVVPTITYGELLEKYGKKFNTLVADCEGALYYILLDEPCLFDGINTVILENDFAEAAHKEYVDGVLAENGFKCVYRTTIDHYMVKTKFKHCQDEFYQVWQRA